MDANETRVIKLDEQVSGVIGDLEVFTAGTAMQNYSGCDACKHSFEGEPYSNISAWDKMGQLWDKTPVGAIIKGSKEVGENKRQENIRKDQLLSEQEKTKQLAITQAGKDAEAKAKADAAMAAALAGSPAAASTGMSTGVKVGIAIGSVVVVGLVIFLVVRSREN